MIMDKLFYDGLHMAITEEQIKSSQEREENKEDQKEPEEIQPNQKKSLWEKLIDWLRKEC